MNQKFNKKDIAIVGMSGRFHGSEDVNEFWENLINGKELLHRYSREELLNLGLSDTIIDNESFVPTESIVENAGDFDYSFFGFTKDEAAVIDPQVRVLHEQVWVALEDAGCNSFSYPGKIGLYLSASSNFNWVAHTAISNVKGVNGFFLSQVSNKDFISTLISYNLNLKGPSYFTSTACSSSLTSIHLGCRSLFLRECSIAVAGGISLDTAPRIGYFYEEGMINSSDGHCRAFDSDSSGTVGGNGSGVVVLKRMEDAIRDKDHIYGVIRSTAANNDGKRKVGYTAPSVSGQAECITLAHKIANVSYDSISYVETHGTGTRLGDPIEVAALNKAFNNDVNHKCAIGSVKSNIGHLDTAAGVAGVIKTCLALKNRKIPPSLHFNKPNPDISFDAGPFYVNTEARDWQPHADTPLRAGVSSFGIGGTNVHAILEEYTFVNKGSASRPYQLLPFSAKSRLSLDSYYKKLTDFIRKDDAPDLADLAYTLMLGREEFKYRSFLVADHSDATSLLTDSEKPASVAVAKKKPNIIFMFPGQGNQYFQMAKDVYEAEPYFKAIVDEGLQILTKLTGESFEDILGYSDEAKSSQEKINKTYYTQPLLFLIECALAKYMMHLGVKPANMIGHSLGEYSAACVAGVFTLEAGLKLMVKRASLMNKVARGKMLAIGVPAESLSSLLNDKLSVAVINTKNSCVISGDIPSINAFGEILTEKEIPFTELKTSHAFHSYMMDDILQDFEQELSQMDLQKPKYPFVSNLTGNPISDEEATAPKYWCRHLRETVKFYKGIEYLLQMDESVFLEVGPGKSMRSFCKQSGINKNQVAIGLVRHPKEKVNDNLYLTKAIGELWSSGVKLDWKAYYENEERYKISAPTYCFEKHTFPMKVDPFSNLAKDNLYEGGVQPYEEWFYQRNWKKSVLFKNQPPKYNNKYLIFSDQNELNDQLKQQLEKEGADIIEVIRGKKFEQKEASLFCINEENELDFQLLFEHLEKFDIDCNNVIFNWNIQGECQEEVLKSFFVLLNISKAFINYAPDSDKKFTIISNNGYDILGGEKLNIVTTTVKTILDIVAQENKNVFALSIDVDSTKPALELVQQIKDEIVYNISDSNIAYRNNKRWIEFYENVDVVGQQSPSLLEKDKTYLITGGLGHLGSVLARHIGKTYGAKVILTGRSALTQDQLLNGAHKNGQLSQGILAKNKKLQSLRKEGVDVHYYQMDVADATAVKEVIQTIEKAHGKIAGLIHAAGNIDNRSFKLIENIDRTTAVQQFDPKIKGTLNLYEAFKNEPLDFVWITSSLATILGGLSYGAYATANKFIDAFIEHHQLDNWVCLNLDGLGESAIRDNEIVDIFEKTHSNTTISQCIVSLRNLHTLIANSKKPKEEKEEEAKKPVSKSEYDEYHVAPVGEIEQKICEIWQSFFGLDRISTTEDFFDLGGDSLKAMTLIKRIHKAYDVEINLIDFFSKPNVKELAAEVELALKLMNVQTKTEGTRVIKI